MKAEQVYNIAIHLPEMEMERSYTLLETKLKRRLRTECKSCKTKINI